MATADLNKDMESMIDRKLTQNNERFENRLMDFQAQMIKTMTDNMKSMNLNNGNGNFRGRGRGNGNGNRGFNGQSGRNEGAVPKQWSGGRGRGRGRSQSINRNRNQRTGNGNEGNFSNGSRQFSREKSEDKPESNQNLRNDSDLNEAFSETKAKKLYENPLLPKDSRLSKKWSKDDAEVYKGKFGTNSEQHYLKQFTEYSIVEAQSGASRCSLELVINCIPKYFESYAENDEHDLRNTIRILKSADSRFEPKEVMNVQRHPGQHKDMESDFIRVTVLFNNIFTPDRIATAAEDNVKDGEESLIQRSITKGLRRRNKSLLEYVDNLNLLRPMNSPYIWSSVMVRGERHIIQKPDPNYVEPSPETEVESQTQPEENPKKSGIFAAVENLRKVNIKMAKTSVEKPMTNTPGLTVEEVMSDLTIKHNGNMELACRELLTLQGVPDKKGLRSRAKNSSSPVT